MGLQSYKPYSRLVTIISGLIIIIAGLDASQVINLFPDYASQINSVLFVCGLIAPAISQELRVGRAEELIKDDLSNSAEKVQVTVNLDGEEILKKVEKNESVEVAESVDNESEGA